MCSKQISTFKFVARIIFIFIIGTGLLSHMSDQDFVGLINGISYFTMISNVMCFCVLFYAVIRRNKCGTRFNIVYGGALLSITLTFFVYNFVLANSDFTMRAMKKVTFDTGDILVHYLVPAIMWIDFLWIVPHKIFNRSYITLWLLIPVVYFIITMTKARAYNHFGAPKSYRRYPYDFMDVDVNGIPYLVSFVGLFTLLCIGIGIVICMLDFVQGMFYTKKARAGIEE